jgi:hypothetical protein
MFGKIAGAFIGKKIADRYGTGGRGMIIGALAPAVARRAFGPLGLALAGGYVAKKIYDGRKRRTRSID